MSYITKLPFEGRIQITYPYGIKDSNYAGGYHQGIDMVGLDNRNVYAIGNGIVSYAGWENSSNPKQGFGRYVSVKYDVTTNGFKKVFFAHLNSINVSNGQNVSNATVLGVMGSTGFSTGPHTHIEIREYNANGKLIKILNPAGYMGVPNSYTIIDSVNYRIKTDTESVSNNYKIVTTSGVNLRESYTINSNKIDAIPYNTKLSVIDTYKGNNWFWGKAKYNSKTGWFAIRTMDNKEVYAEKI